MLAGEPPYGDVPALSRYAMVLHEEPKRPRDIEPSIPSGIEAVIQGAMARDPASRTQTAHDLETQLGAFDRRVAPHVRSTQPSPVIRQPVPSESLRSLQPHTTAELHAADIQMRAKQARPIGAFVAAASSLAAGAWLAAMLATIVMPTSTGERALIALFGIAATAGVGMLHIHRLRPSWASAPAVARLVRSFSRALLFGTITLGGLELATYGCYAAFNAAPLGVGVRLVLTGAAAVLGLGWRTWRLDERMRARWLRDRSEQADDDGIG
jgi:serine/threonine-protein kinase